ncbi:40293_t:CDS:2 [Gigaspora margarita]|uniref:40293_t:CDS:1 n=1 Tax=Gigaspora margarita TaxID=4874 RepID=A0ABN7UAV8_GIGMA|nr:40293_t:CDS:2 [Gigaspora margarita]
MVPIKKRPLPYEQINVAQIILNAIHSEPDVELYIEAKLIIKISKRDKRDKQFLID